jgi:cholesterol transport system auxiliary component
MPVTLSRRIALLGTISALSGCGAVSALNSAATPLDTYDLAPVPGSRGGRRTGRTLLVARPDAPAALTADRIMVKPDAVSITYLPDARWSDEAPLVVQSLLVRSIAATGRIGYVGRSEGGPVPDTALLVRLDAFQVEEDEAGALTARVDMALSLIEDRNQRVLGSRGFAGSAPAADDSPTAVVAAFQAVLTELLPEMADWTLARA